jgi:hypothetical protein
MDASPSLIVYIYIYIYFIPPKLDRISFLLPILSTSQTPTNVNIKLTKAVTAANQIAVDWSLTPVIWIIVAL